MASLLRLDDYRPSFTARNQGNSCQHAGAGELGAEARFVFLGR